MKALVVVDMLNDFVVNDEYHQKQNPNVDLNELRRLTKLYDGKLAVPNVTGIIDNIALLKRFNKGLTVYANDAHDKDDAEFNNWPVHAVKKTYGAKVIDELAVQNKDFVIEKQDLVLFTNPLANKLLLERNVKELYVTGVATEYCVKGLILTGNDKYGNLVKGAIDLGYKVNLVIDAIAGVDEIILPDGNVVLETKGAVAKALVEMGNAGVRPVYTAQALEELI